MNSSPGSSELSSFKRTNPLYFLSSPFKGIDGGFPLRFGEFDSRHPFRVHNHFTSNGPVTGFRRQRTLKNGRPDPGGAKNSQSSSPVHHKSSFLNRVTTGGLETLSNAVG